MLLIVYVDDMKLAGPAQHMKATWEALGKNIKLEVPKGDVTASANNVDLQPRLIMLKLQPRLITLMF